MAQLWGTYSKASPPRTVGGAKWQLCHDRPGKGRGTAGLQALSCHRGPICPPGSTSRARGDLPSLGSVLSPGWRLPRECQDPRTPSKQIIHTKVFPNQRVIGDQQSIQPRKRTEVATRIVGVIGTKVSPFPTPPLQINLVHTGLRLLPPLQVLHRWVAGADQNWGGGPWTGVSCFPPSLLGDSLAAGQCAG